MRSDSEGLRTHRIDEQGLATVYEYTERGQLSRVYNPDTILNRDRIIGGFERLAPGSAKNIAEERYGFTFDEQNRLKAALADSTLTFPSAQNMLVESLSYDENGNRTKI